MEKSTDRGAVFLFVFLACGDIEVNPGPGQVDKGFSIYQQNFEGFGITKKFWNIL